MAEADPRAATRSASASAASTALEKVSFELRRGEVLALAGDNGAGKSTLIKAISGVYQPDEGEICLQGRAGAAFASPREARDARHRDDLPGPGAGRQSRRRRQRLPRPRADPPSARLPAARSTAAACARPRATVLRHARHRHRRRKLDAPVRDLSGGQRQAVAIGRAIYWNAELLIMDEPTAALGVPEQRKVRELILRPQAAGRGHHLHQPQSAATSSPSPTASWSCAAASRPASAGRPRPSDDEIVKLMVGG